jgi:hypothetical protein
MSIKKYTNIDGINNKTENEGQFLQADDLFIVSKSEIDTTDFGDCKYDVMEVSLYDINNNILPQSSGNNVAYIKMGDIKNYMYQITNKQGLKELAIDVEKLINDLGYTNGIIKVNINFVRYKVGSENELERVWIEEISPSREEIRIVPLKTKFSNINDKTTTQFKNLKNLNKDFKYYKKALLNSLNSFDNTFLDKINSHLETKYGKDFFNTLKKDFGLSSFDTVRNKISNDFKQSINYYLNNKYYKISESTFGKPSVVKFEDCDVYDFEYMLVEIQEILSDCIDFNLKSLKRRELNLKTLPKEFAITELQKQIQNNLDSFNTQTTLKKNVYSPDGTVVVFNDTNTGAPKYPETGTFIKKLCKGYDRYHIYADGNGGTYEELVETNSADCGYTPPPTNGGGGTGGGGRGGGDMSSRNPTMPGNYNNGQAGGPSYQDYQK